MDTAKLNRLRKAGAVAKTGVGECVHVTLQYQGPISSKSIAERQIKLGEKFSKLETILKPLDVSILLGSISPSAMTVEAFLPVLRYDQIIDQLKIEPIRVDPVEIRQVI